MRTGTSHFVTRQKAIRYYRDYEADENAAARAVDRKVAEGEIHIGPPVVKPGQKLNIIDNGTRYEIDEEGAVTTQAATADQVRKHYRDQGYAVRIGKDGHVEYRLEGEAWREGRWVSEYRVDDTGAVHLR